MYRHILISTDGSELAGRGVAHGLALAKSLGAKVSAINVVEPLFAVTGDFASVLDRVANAAKEAGVSCETIQVENVPPHEAIIATAEEKGCDLIVMSSHGRSGLSALLIGSVTNKVLTHAKTPYWFVNECADRSMGQINAPEIMPGNGMSTACPAA